MKISFKSILLYFTGLLLIPNAVMADTEIVKRVKKALEYLNSGECSIEEAQKLNYLCKAVTDIDLNELVNRARKSSPCIKIADDFSSLTTSAMGKNYTINVNLKGLLCGSNDSFSASPSDGCMTSDERKNAKSAAKELVNQLVSIITNSLDTKKLFDRSPFCMGMWDNPFSDNPFKQLKEDLTKSFQSAPLCNTECENGKDKDGYVTEYCCQKNNGIFVVQENKNYCCPNTSGQPQNCPANQQKATDECVSSCRMGTVNNDCCDEKKHKTNGHCCEIGMVWVD